LVTEHFPTTPYAARAAELSAINFFRAGEYKSISPRRSGSLWRRVDPDVQKKFPETLYWMGHAAMRLRDYGQAQKLFQEFVRMAPPEHNWLSQGLRAQALAYRDGQKRQRRLARFAESVSKRARGGQPRLSWPS
jgi:hypothetical protein